MKCITILLILLTSLLCRAQAPYRFSRLFLDAGLSDARISSIVQDKYGFMWFGTPNGLNRYDGYSIKIFYQDKENGLPSNAIVSLYSSKKGDLWIGTSAGLVKYDFANEKFLRIDTSGKAAKELSAVPVNDIEEDKSGNIYVAHDKGISRFLSKEQKWENLNTLSKTKGALRRIRRLKFFTDNLLIASTSGNIPLFTVNIQTYVQDSISSFIDSKNPNMYGLEKLNDEEIIGGLLSFGIMKINIRNKTSAFVPGVLNRNDSIRYNTVYDILKDSRGRIWMASFYFRLAEYVPAQNKVITFDKDPYNPYGFEGNSALCVFQDRQHNIWVGTSGKGVYYFNPDYDAVKFVPGNDYDPPALQRAAVLSITVLDSNNLLIGTEKGPSFYNYTTNTHRNYEGIKITGINAPLEYTHVGLPDKNGRIVWMGTNRLGLVRYDSKTRGFQCFSRLTRPFPLDDDGITDLLQLPDGNIFLIGFGHPGIFNANTFKYISIRNDSTNPVLKLTSVSSICYDAEKHIWLSTNDGKLYEYDPLLKLLTNKSELLNTITGLKTIYKITSQQSDLYMATNAGLVILKNKNRPIIYSIKPPGQALNEFRGILPDGENVWFCNNRVLGRLHLPSGKIIFLGEKEGMANIQLFSRSLALSPSGKILIGSNKGYFEIEKNKLKKNDMPPAAFLTGFRVYDKPLKTSEAISGIKNISLSYNENFFAFDISAFNYEQATDLQYAYMLENFDKDWHYTGNQRTGSYTNVPGGNYILRFKVRNSSGEWNENGQVIHIHIGRHFTNTWWFKLLLILLIASLIYLIYRYRIKNINKNARLRSDYEIKLNELENSALRTQMNPHFIFNSLNTINSFISLNETAQAHQYISRFSKLIRYILDHSRQRKILLSDELEVLKLYIEIEQIRFNNKFKYEIILQDDIDATTVEVPPLIIQPFVENAILHGLLPLKDNGLLKIHLHHTGDMLYCIVEDNGIGREKAKALRKKYIITHTSHGIEITLKRILLFNKEHGKEASVEIIDLAHGTQVVIPVSWEESF